MTLLDTHIWIWWVHDDPSLPKWLKQKLDAAAGSGLGVSVVSCWEVALLAGRGRIELHSSVHQWLNQALGSSGVTCIGLTPEIAVEATVLPGELHRDPADRFIVATARVHGMPLATVDGKLLTYPHVQKLLPA